jgi:xanthine/uracil permease
MGKWNGLPTVVLAGAALALLATVASGGSLAVSRNPFRERETQPC